MAPLAPVLVLIGCGVETRAPAPVCPVASDPGAPTLRRLNRTEYSNTLRALLQSSADFAARLPADGSAYGFDTVGEALPVTPVHVEAWHHIAEEAVTAALAGPARDGIVICQSGPAGAAACARRIFAAFGRRAWRRPLDGDELDRLTGLLNIALQQGDTFTEGIALGLRAVLSSPHFLLRVEHALSQHELATRLALFLWSEGPDETLLDLADRGYLAHPDVLNRETRRLLADPRASLVSEFAEQWLGVRALALASPDAERFGSFDAALSAAMADETRAFFDHFLRYDLPARELLTADFTYANDRLAAHYGLPAPGSTTATRVDAGSERGGLLTQGTVLTVTSTSLRASESRRGAWILERLTCAELGEPPPGADTPDDPGSNAEARALAEARSHDPSCAGCHDRMDPLGMALSAYDGVGAFSPVDATGAAVDSSGVLEDGTRFAGPSELAQILRDDGTFARCLPDQLFTYAIGRRARSAADLCALDGLQAAAEDGASLPELITQLTATEAFRMRSPEP